MSVPIWIIIALLVVIAIVLFLTKLKIRIRVYNLGLGIAVNIGAIRILSYPKKKKIKVDGKEVVAKPRRKSNANQTIDVVFEVFETIQKFVGDLKDNIVIERLKIIAIVADENPALSAIAYGASAAAICTAIPILESNFIVKEKQINVSLDFQTTKPKIDVDVIMTIKFILFIRTIARFGFDYLDVLKGLKKKAYEKVS